MSRINRRSFLNKTCCAAVGLSAIQYRRVAAAPSEQVVVGIMGVRGRGALLASMLAGHKAARVATVCDVDESVTPAVVDTVTKLQSGSPPRVVQDVRRILDDKSIDALVIAAPNHWHALATVWACQAGKDVLVEKPVSHNIVEGRRMVEAARKYNRIVQSGTQRRCSSHWEAAMSHARSGKLGHVGMVRAWILRKRKNLGRVPDSPVPPGVDYDLWLGPAPQVPFNANRFHYNWHWHWDYGGGELANNGVHFLDMACLGLGAFAPDTVTSTGGKLVFDDDQETPDTLVTAFQFPKTLLLWEQRLWSNLGLMNEEGAARIGGGLIFYGDRGSLLINDNEWRVIADGKVTETHPGVDTSVPLIDDFLQCVKSRTRPKGDIEIGHRSATLCHLGNIAYRLGRKVRWDGATERFVDDAEADKFLAREYRKPFVLPESV